MTITSDKETGELRPGIAEQLRELAELDGVGPVEYAKRVIEEHVARHYSELERPIHTRAVTGVAFESFGKAPEKPPAVDAAYLLTLPPEEQDRILAAAAEQAAPLYEADLALPPSPRKRTLSEMAGFAAHTRVEGRDGADIVRELRAEWDKRP